MKDMFISVLNMSLTASYVIAAIMLARLFLKKAPKIISYALWAVAGFRLVFPFSFESVFSLIPFKSAPIPADITMQPIPRVDSGISIVDNVVSQVLPAATPVASVNPLQICLTVGSYLWLSGIAVMQIYSVVSIILLKRRLNGAALIEGNIYESDNLKTPFVLGLFRPRIYIPTGLSEEEKRYIILHERTHIRRCDHIVKLFAYFVLCLHWFNPLAWAAFVLLSTDMEMSCDECVLKEMGGDIKKAYSTSLLSLATGQRLINGSPLAFGEGNIKGRIKNVLNFKKPAAWVITVSVLLVAVLSIGFAANKSAPDNSSDWGIYNFPSYLYDRATLNTEATIYPTSFETVNATLTNTEMEGGLQCSEAFTFVKQAGDEWRIVPYIDIKPSTILDLAVGASKTYTLTPDMLSVKLEAGNYRIITDVWYTNEAPPQIVRTVWADFTIAAPDSTGWQDIRIGMLRDDVHKIMGEPDGMLSGFWGDIYLLDNDNRVIIYYDANGLVEHVKTAETAAEAPSSEATRLEPTSPKLLPGQSIGVDMVHLDYASDDIVIFHDYFGLFVYDLNSQKIVRSLDLNPIGCAATQGDNYCDVTVSADGNTVQLHPMSSKNMYVYAVSDNTLRETAYERMENRFADFVDIVDVIDYQKAGNYSHTAVKFDTGEYGYLHTSDWTLGTLTYVRGSDMMYRLFESNTSVSEDKTYIVTDGEIASAKDAALSYYENTVFKGRVTDIIQITDISEFKSAVIPHRIKDVVIAFYSTMSDNAKRMIILTKEIGGKWEVINEGV